MSTKISRSVINCTIEIVFSLNYLYLYIFLKSPTLDHRPHLLLVYTIEIKHQNERYYTSVYDSLIKNTFTNVLVCSLMSQADYIL